MSFFQKNNFKLFISKNKWIILASIFFILWKLFLIEILWDNRLVPPEPSDSYIYIMHIESVKQCPQIFCKNSILPMNTYGGYSHLFYRFIFGNLAKILRISSETMYYFSFFIGSILILPVTIFFLKSLNIDKGLISLSIIFLSLPQGGGAMHNFSWIVPSFFALLIIFVLFSLVIGNYKKWKFFIPILVIASIFTHIISIYLLMILPIFFLIYYLFTRKFDKLLFIKIFFTFITATFVYTPLSIYLNHVSKGVPYGVEIFFKESAASIKSVVQKNTNPKEDFHQKQKYANSEINLQKIFPGYNQIKNNYLKWLFLNPAGLSFFLIILITLLHYKQYKIISLYFASLIFTLGASIHPYSVRSLLFLVPITFVFFGHGVFFSFKLINKNISNNIYKAILTSLALIILIIFAIINLLFSYFWNEYVNTRDNYNLNKDYINYLKLTIPKNESVFYDSQELKALHQMSLRTIKITRFKDQSNYSIIVKRAPDSFNNSRLNIFLNYLSDILNVNRKKENPKRIIPTDNSLLPLKQFGDIIIYKN